MLKIIFVSTTNKNDFKNKFKVFVRTSIKHSEQSPHNISMSKYIQIKRKKHIYLIFFNYLLKHLNLLKHKIYI
jgi:hypothetical protein